MKRRNMATQIEAPKDVLIQFRVPEKVAYGLRIVAAKEKFSTLAKYLKHVANELAAKQ